MAVAQFENKTIQATLREMEVDRLKGLSAEQVAAARHSGISNRIDQGRSGLWAFLLARLKSGETILAITISVLILILLKYQPFLIAFGIYFAYFAFFTVAQMRGEGILRYHASRARPRAMVLRDGQQQSVPFEEIVHSDIVYLSAGSVVPCDMRLIDSQGLVVDQSSLSGSGAVLEKDAHFLGEGNLFNSGKKNMVFMQSVVVEGTGIGVATAIGYESEYARRLENDPAQGPRFALLHQYETIKQYGYFASAFCALFALVLCIVLKKQLPDLLLITAFTAFLVYPKNFQPAISVLMSRGIRRLSKKGIHIGKTESVYTLAGTTTFLCDKKQAFLKDRCRVEQLYIHEKMSGLHSAGFVRYQLLLQGMALCYPQIPEFGDIKDYFENHILDMARLKNSFTLTQEENTPQQPYGALFTAQNGETLAYHIGAVPDLLPHCTAIAAKEGIRPITKNDYRHMKQALLTMQHQGVQIFCICVQAGVSSLRREGLVFAGFVSTAELIRPDAKRTVASIRNYGMNLVLMTEGSEDDARQFALKIGMPAQSAVILDSAQFDNVQGENLRKYTILTNLTPQQKERAAAVFAGKSNAALTLSEHCGNMRVSTAKSTDTQKKDADLHTADTSLSGLLSAVVSCQFICGNIKKYMTYLLSLHFTLAVSLLLGMLFFGEKIYSISYAYGGLHLFGYLLALLLGEELPGKRTFEPVDVRRLFGVGDLVRFGVYTTVATAALLFAYGKTPLGPWRVLLIFAYLAVSLSQVFRNPKNAIFTPAFFHNIHIAFVGASLVIVLSLLLHLLPAVAMPVPMLLQCAAVGLMPLLLHEAAVFSGFISRKFL